MPSAPTMQYSVSPVDESLGNPAELGGQATDLAPAPPVSSEEKAVEKFPAPKLDAGQPRVEESSEGELQSEAKSQQK